MQLISFDALCTLGIPHQTYLKPELMFQQLGLIIQADGILFPEYWQINPLVYGLKTRIFPNQATYLIGHNKIEMTRCFQALAPEHVPFTLILANTDNNAQAVWEKMSLPFVVKYPKSSRGQGVFLIQTFDEWQQYLQTSDVIFAQEYLPIDRDLRIVWVGDRIVDGYWRLQSEQGFYNNVARGGKVEQGIIPKEARKLVRRLARGLGINYGGFDVVMLGSHPYVFEFNRIFGTQGMANRQQYINSKLFNYLQREWSMYEPNPALTG